MDVQFILTLVGVATALAIARYAWQRRAIPGAEFFALYMVSAVVWSFSVLVGYASEDIHPVLETLANLLQTIGIFVMPAAWLAFAIKYTGRGQWLTRRTWIVLAIIPLVALILSFAHDISKGTQLAPGMALYDIQSGLEDTFEWLMRLYTTLLIFAGGLLLLQEILRSPRIYRMQYLILLIGGVTPWLAGLPAIWEMEMFHDEIILGAFIVGGLICAWGIFRYQIFEIMPIALDTVVESLDEGVIVLDTRDRIVALNPSAQAITGLPGKPSEGKPIVQALATWPDLGHCLAQEYTHADLCLEHGPERRFYDLRISPLYGQRQMLSGKLMVIHDVTERRQVEMQIQRISNEHARRNRELTLLNRVIAVATSNLESRAVLETVCRELAMAFHSPRVAAALVDDECRTLTVEAEYCMEGYPSSVGAVIPIENNPATQHVMEHKEPLAVLDAQHDPRMAPVHDLMRRQGVASLLILPLIVRDAVVGTIGLDAVERREFSDAEITLAANVAAAASQALENAQAEEALRQSEERLKLAIEGAALGLWDVDLVTGAAFIDRLGQGYLGFVPGEQLSGAEVDKKLEQVVHPEDMGKAEAAFARHLSGETPLLDVELRAQHQSGEPDTWSWILLRGKVVARDEEGQARRMAGITQDITERKRAEEALRQSEERYRLLVENAPLGIISMDSRGQVIDVNPELLSLLGSPSPEATRDINVLTFPPLIEAGIADAARRCLDGEPIISEHPYTSTWGRSAHLRLYLTPIRDDGGQITGVQGMVEDITERKQAVEALRESEERLKLAVEGANLGLWDLNLAEGAKEMSISGLFDVLGYEPGELEPTQACWQGLIHPEDRPKAVEALQAYFAGETPLYEVEHRLQAKSGGWEWVMLRGAVVERDEQGHPQRMTGICQRITARKQMEEAVRESEERLKIAMEAASLALWDIDLTTDELVVARPRADGQSWGYDRLAGSRRWEEGVHPEDWPKVAEAMSKHFAGETPVYEVEFRGKYFGKAPDDEWAWVLHRGKVVARDEQGQPLRATGIQEDISARKQAEEELRQAKEAAETANRAKSAFLANMSHELRTPLNAILGFAQLMARDPTLDTEQQENLDTIRHSGEHLLALINDVLEVSKIEAGRMTLQERDFDLHRLLADVESMFRLRATDKDLQLLFDRDPEVPQFVRADEGKLRQVLINLLSNAVKFTEEGGITVRTRYEDRHLFFEVEDTGIGIPPDELEDLFDPFVQTASGQVYTYQEGTGLGLTISQHFINLMDGSISVSSELGQGSTFRFDVQVELAEATDVQVKHPRQKVVGLEPGQQVYRLLVVEDREANRKLLVKLLTSLGSPPHGFEVREAINGREAVEIWEEWEPHLIWMDMRMPVMDGYEATKHIKATIKGQATVIIALTASAFEEDRVQILSFGCDDFVRKPFRESQIFERLENHLGVRFLYEAQAPLPPIEPTDTQKVRTLKALAALPAEWVSELHQAATQADADLVLALVEQVRADHEQLAGALEYMVQGFRFDTIMTLTKQAGE